MSGLLPMLVGSWLLAVAVRDRAIVAAAREVIRADGEWWDAPAYSMRRADLATVYVSAFKRLRAAVAASPSTERTDR